MSDKNGLTGRKQSYKQVRRVFPKTIYGTVSLELAVGQEAVAIINGSQLKGTVARKTVRESDDLLVSACRDSDEKKFNSLCDELDTVA